MTEQPNYYEPLLRFDQYTVVWKKSDGWHVTQLFKNLSWLSAEMVAGVEHIDFCMSMEHTGWLGTCPQWCGFKPVVTIPRGESLIPHHLDFIMECIT
jgi:hypothetical protein